MKGSPAFNQLAGECALRRLRMQVETCRAGNGEQLLRVRCVGADGRRFAAAHPTQPGRELDTQALALVDLLRRSA